MYAALKSEAIGGARQRNISSSEDETSIFTTTKNLLSPKEKLLAEKPLTTQKLIQVQDYLEAFGYASHGRSYFSTEGGRIGLGPLHTKRGDLVCIFYNGRTPYILRPKEGGATC